MPISNRFFNTIAIWGLLVLLVIGCGDDNNDSNPVNSGNQEM